MLALLFAVIASACGDSEDVLDSNDRSGSASTPAVTDSVSSSSTVSEQSPPSNAAMTSTIEAYLVSITTGDREAYLALFTDDATVEDPIGSGVSQGKDELGAFFDQLQGLADSNTLTLIGSPRIVENEAIFMFQSILVMEGQQTRICPIDHVVFNSEAKIVSLRAFWTQDDFQPFDPARPGKPCRI